jgi:hypothetical protein
MNDRCRSGEDSEYAGTSPLCKLRNRVYYDIVQSKFIADSLRTMHGRMSFSFVSAAGNAKYSGHMWFIHWSSMIQFTSVCHRPSRESVGGQPRWTA